MSVSTDTVTFPYVVLIERMTGEVCPANKWAHIILCSFVVSQKEQEWRCSTANYCLNEGSCEGGLNLWMCSHWTERKPLENKWETKSDVRVDIQQPQLWVQTQQDTEHCWIKRWKIFHSPQQRVAHRLQHIVWKILLVSIQSRCQCFYLNEQIAWACKYVFTETRMKTAAITCSLA